MTKSLNQLTAGESAIIIDINDSILIEHKQRLSQLGFTKGNHVICLQTPGFGSPHVYRINSAVYSLDKDLSSQITVEQ